MRQREREREMINLWGLGFRVVPDVGWDYAHASDGRLTVLPLPGSAFDFV